MCFVKYLTVAFWLACLWKLIIVFTTANHVSLNAFASKVTSAVTVGRFVHIYKLFIYRTSRNSEREYRHVRLNAFPFSHITVGNRASQVD